MSFGPKRTVFSKSNALWRSAIEVHAKHYRGAASTCSAQDFGYLDISCLDSLVQPGLTPTGDTLQEASRVIDFGRMGPSCSAS